MEAVNGFVSCLVICGTRPGLDVCNSADVTYLLDKLCNSKICLYCMFAGFFIVELV